MREIDERTQQRAIVMQVDKAQKVLSDAMDATLEIRKETDTIREKLANVVERLDELNELIDAIKLGERK